MPTHVLRHRSARFEITQELQPQTTVESADVYTRRTSADVSAEMRV